MPLNKKILAMKTKIAGLLRLRVASLSLVLGAIGALSLSALG